MRKLRAALVGILLALPAALVLPGVVPAAAVNSAPSCGGVPPVIDFVTRPTLTSTHGGGSVSITSSPQTGSPNFGSGGTVWFSDSGGHTSVSHTFPSGSPNTIGINASSAYSGEIYVCINNDNQVYDAGFYTFNPIVSSATPGDATEGSTITVNGNFYNNQLAVAVGSCGVGFTFVNEAQLKFTMPGPANVCSGTVSVTETAHDSYRFATVSGGSVSVDPVIGSVSCANPCYPGQPVSVSGSGFGGAGSWSLGGASGSWSGSDSGFSFGAPDGSEGGSLVVTNSAGQSSSPAGSVSIMPHIAGLSPSSAKDGDTVTISGQDFGSAPGSVTLGGQPIDSSNLSGWGMDKVTFAVPAGAVPGTIGVTTADGRQSVNTATLKLVPVISSVSPASAAPGSYVTITGSTFGQNAGSVTIGGKPAPIADWADTAIIAVVPSGATSGKLIVNSGYGTSVAWGQKFTVTGGGSSTSTTSGGYTGYTNSGTLNVKPNYGFLPLPKAPPGVAFHLTAPSDNVKPGSAVDITVNLAINGKAVAGATITFQVSTSPGSDTSLSVPSAVTDQNGIAHVTLKTSKKPGQTFVIAHSGAFADQIRIVTLSPTASLGGVPATIFKTSTLDPHILIPFVGALILAVLLLLGTVVLQYVLHRRHRVAPVAAAAPVVEAVAVVDEAPAAKAAPKPRKPRTRKPTVKVMPDPVVGPEPVALDLAAGAEDIAPVIQLRPADAPAEPRITRTRARAKTDNKG